MPHQSSRTRGENDAMTSWDVTSLSVRHRPIASIGYPLVR